MVKIKLQWDEYQDSWCGDRLKFKQDCENNWMIISEEELIGHIEKIRVGTWQHWCITLLDGCYLSPGCTDETREMQRLAYSQTKPKTK